MPLICIAPARNHTAPILGIQFPPPPPLPVPTPNPLYGETGSPALVSHMCKDRRNTLASDPKPRPSPRASRSSETLTSFSSAGFPTGTTTAAGAVSFTSSVASFTSIRDSMREAPLLYPFPEICSATNNFLFPRLSSAAAWRCSLRGTDAVVLQRTFRGDPDALLARLSALCRSHHTSIARLLGASLSGDGCIYLAYEHVAGASLADCLRNPRNPGFTPLSSWTSRMQVAADLAQGLEYIHHYSSSTSPLPSDRLRRGTVHNRIKSSGVIVTEPGFRAKICHFGAAELAGEVTANNSDEDPEDISDISSLSLLAEKERSESRTIRIEGTRGYIAPEVIAGGLISQRSDVFAFGTVVLELLSSEEPLRYRWDKARGDYERVSLIETAMEVYGEEAAAAAEGGRRGRIRRWVDRRLRDSFPEEVAEKLIRVALRCVEAEPGLRPDMVWVAGKVSRMFIDSMAWEERLGVQPDISRSFAPR